MLIIPAIDLKDGKVVRLVQGKFDKKVYSSDPVKTAKYWQRQGAKLIHVVDLDGAFTGTPKNIEIAKQIAREIKVPIEFGGGIRNKSTIDDLFSAGVERIVLGTKAIEDEKFLKDVLKKFGARLIVSIDEEKGSVFVRGWKKSGGKLSGVEFAKKLKAMGLKEIIYTDISRDGTLSGPAFLGVKRLLKETGISVIASGGISSLKDIYKLKELEKLGLKGVIVGKALYEGRFTLAEAIKAS